MNGMITTDEQYELEKVLPRLKEYQTGNVVDKVTCDEKSVLNGKGKKVALLDLGAKKNIADSLHDRECEVTIYPAHTTGADTYKLKYGHRGGNHPVKDLETGRVYISSQNHGYAVDDKALDENVAVPAFVNVNDGTNEGLKYIGKNIFTVQFHPEACPGPQDSSYLFDRFITMMGGNQ